MKVKFEIEMEIDEKDFHKLKVLEHHANWLLDLDSWKEIKSISKCRITTVDGKWISPYRDYLIGCIASDERCVECGYDKDNNFIDAVVRQYEDNLKYICEEYCEVEAKDEAIEAVLSEWGQNEKQKLIQKV